MPEYLGDYSLAIGKQLPDGVFLDACDEPVRLHDFAGSYLLVEMAAVDCPACREMAEVQEMWVKVFADHGIQLNVVTLLAPSLAGKQESASADVLKLWASTFGIKGPVLGDRQWGLNVLSKAIATDPVSPSSGGYPSWVLAAPNLDVLALDLDLGRWGAVSNALHAHLGFQRIEAESFTQSSPTISTFNGGSGRKVGSAQGSDNDWVSYSGIDLTGVKKVSALISNGGPPGDLELRIDTPTGPLLGTLHVVTTGRWRDYKVIEAAVQSATGVHDLYVSWTNQPAEFGDLDYLLLSK